MHTSLLLTSSPLLEVEDLVRSFGPGNTVLSGINFSLNEGEALLVRGPSGVGKTQLLRAIASLDDLQGGQLRLHGKTPNQLGQPHWRTQASLSEYTWRLASAAYRRAASGCM